MTLEITISDSTPTGVGTYLYNTIVLEIDVASKNVMRKALNAEGKPIVRWVGEAEQTATFKLLVSENDDTVADVTLGLSDLDTIRKASVGYIGSGSPGLRIWLRDTEGEYFFKDWKSGYLTGFTCVPAIGFPNVVGATLYRVGFKIMLIDTTDAEKSLFRW